MAAHAKAVMLVWTDIPPRDEYGFNEWYDREHFRSRVVEIPGFIAGSRLIALSGAPKYVAFYEAEDVEVFRSEPYLAVVREPDPLSRRFIPKFRNTIRTVARITATVGSGEGGIVGLFAFSPEENSADMLRHWATGALLPELVGQHGIVAAHLWETDRSVLEASRSRHLRTGDRVADWVIKVDATTEEDLSAARDRLLADSEFLDHGAAGAPHAGVFRLLYRLSS